MYRLNTVVDTRNTLMLNNLAPQSAQFAIKAIDSVAGKPVISLSPLCQTKDLKQAVFVSKDLKQAVFTVHSN